MKTVTLVLLLLLVFVSCKNYNNNTNQDIVIEGNVENIPDGKIYLVESRKWKTPYDSTTITNGKFRFSTITSDSFSPFLAAIHYWVGDKVFRLKFRNHTLGSDSLKYATDAFYLEPGTIKIEGDNNTAPYLRIFAGKENELLFKNQFLDFGWVANLDTEKRFLKIEQAKNTIRENPDSYFLLESIYRSKEQYIKSELTELFSLFTKTVQQSKEGDSYKKYLAVRPGDNAVFPNLKLLNPEDSLIAIFNSAAKINMLVFWASWCAPCRKEVPQLKGIAKKYSGTGLQLISISIDEHKKNWLKAVAYEKMSWPQVHIPLHQIDEVQNQFRFITIPLVIFTDSNGKEIKRFADYDPESMGAYEDLINQYIK